MARATLLAVAVVGLAVGTSRGPAAPVPKAPAPAVPAGKFPPPDAKEWKDAGNGLKVWDAKVGDGDEVRPGDTVTVRYTGWLIDGTEFDGNRDAKEPATFPLANLVKGWQAGVPGMKPGGVRRLLIPPELGYGARGAPPKIPAKATLVFEIALVESDGP